MLSPDIQAKFAIWRQKAAEGTLSLEETREAIAFLRGDRLRAASATPAASRAKAKVAIPSADDLLSELGDL